MSLKITFSHKYDGRRLKHVLADTIRRLRKEKNLTQEALASMLGVERTTVTMWESGGITPPTKHLVTLAEALGCTLDDLLRGEGT